MAEHRRATARREAALVTQTREHLRAALARHATGTAVWVYGSLVKLGRFREWSDVDLASEALPAGANGKYLQSVLNDEVGRKCGRVPA